MPYGALADAVVVFHFTFVAFVIVGGLLVLRWPRLMWAHLPCVAWGIYIELSGGLCPLTPLENNLREWGGLQGYEGGFVDHYIMPVLYPAGLTHELQILLAIGIFVINAACYGTLFYLHRRRKAAQAAQVPEQVEPVGDGPHGLTPALQVAENSSPYR